MIVFCCKEMFSRFFVQDGNIEEYVLILHGNRDYVRTYFWVTI